MRIIALSQRFPGTAAFRRPADDPSCSRPDGCPRCGFGHPLSALRPPTAPGGPERSVPGCPLDGAKRHPEASPDPVSPFSTSRSPPSRRPSHPRGARRSERRPTRLRPSNVQHPSQRPPSNSTTPSPGESCATVHPQGGKAGSRGSRSHRYPPSRARPRPFLPSTELSTSPARSPDARLGCSLSRMLPVLAVGPPGCATGVEHLILWRHKTRRSHNRWPSDLGDIAWDQRGRPATRSSSCLGAGSGDT
jgi:hypothetical protein